MLDDICWRYYGSERQMMSVLDANPGLAALGARHHDHPS
ncbi:tail protein X [Enterobacter cloacae]